MSQSLIYMVGPSGVGKDSLLAWLAQHPRTDLPVPLHIARRSITRPEDGGTEAHEPLSEQAFSELEAGGGFAMHWAANGLRYGIRRAELAALEHGHWVLVNGSRAYVARLRQGWPGASVCTFKRPPMWCDSGCWRVVVRQVPNWRPASCGRKTSALHA